MKTKHLPFEMNTANMNDFGSFITDDGRRVTLRRLKSDDVELLIDLFHNLSSESKYKRFHVNADHVGEELIQREAQRLADLDPDRQFALVALDDSAAKEQAVGVARFDRLSANPADAEAAIVVRDDFHGQGLGQHLLETLTRVARQQKIVRFVLITTTDNVAMTKLAKKVWPDVEIKTQFGDQEIWAKID